MMIVTEKKRDERDVSRGAKENRVGDKLVVAKRETCCRVLDRGHVDERVVWSEIVVVRQEAPVDVHGEKRVECVQCGAKGKGGGVTVAMISVG
jgi:hypothetical protein